MQRANEQTSPRPGGAPEAFKKITQYFQYQRPNLEKDAAPSTAEPRRLTRAASSALATSPEAPKSQAGSSEAVTSNPKQSRLAPLKRSSSVAFPAAKRQRSAGYAAPSRYAHLPNLLTDSLVPDLICVFIGLNPGLKTAATGHAYAHPSNLFWRLLHSSGCTPRRCAPSETHDLPQIYCLGNTNIVARATANGAELSKQEMDEGVAILEEKAGKFQPEAVVIVGKSIWESIWRVKHSKAITKHEFKYGWQDVKENMGVTKGWKGARVFVATTTSGLAASMSQGEKEAIWKDLGTWVEKRRTEKGFVGDRRIVNGVVETDVQVPT